MNTDMDIGIICQIQIQGLCVYILYGMCYTPPSISSFWYLAHWLLVSPARVLSVLCYAAMRMCIVLFLWTI